MQRSRLDSFRPIQAPALIAEPNDDQLLGHPRPHPQSSDIRPDTTNASQNSESCGSLDELAVTFCFFMTCMCCYLSFCVTLTSGSVDTRGFCICSHVITLSQWKEGEKIAESGAGLAHFWMFTSFVGMCVCT